MADYWLLFSSGFISATLFPGGSEVLYVYSLTQEPALKWIFFGAVTSGNCLGAIVTYFLGYYAQFGQEKTANKYPKIFLVCKTWGSVVLLFSWLPVIGDVICLFAGWLKLPKKTAFMAIVIGKSVRYLGLMFILFI